MKKKGRGKGMVVRGKEEDDAGYGKRAMISKKEKDFRKRLV